MLGHWVIFATKWETGVNCMLTPIITQTLPTPPHPPIVVVCVCVCVWGGGGGGNEKSKHLLL